MKKIKLSLTVIFCLIFFGGIVAFKTVCTKTTVAIIKNERAIFGQWFVYNNGFAFSSADALNPSNYRPLRGTENVNNLCSGSQTLCAIYAEPNPSNNNIPLIDMTQPIYSSIWEYYNFGTYSSLFIRLKNHF